MTLRIRIKTPIYIEARNSENEVVASGARDVSDNVLLIPDTDYTVKDQDDNVLGTGSLVSCKEGQEINVSVSSDVTAEIKDRWGLEMPDVVLNAGSPAVDYSEEDFTPLALSREASWASKDTAIQTAVSAFIAADTKKKLISLHPNMGGTAACHKWNTIYPYDDNRAQRNLFSAGLGHSSLGVGSFDGFHWIFSHVNVQSFTNSYNFGIGFVLTSDLGTSLGVTKNVFSAVEFTGVSADLTINTTTGNITYYLFGVSATYVPGAPEADYTGMRYYVMRDGTSLKLFINGVLVQTTTPSFVLAASSYTLNSTIRFGGQGSGNLALESTLGTIHMASDLTDAEVATNDGIIATLEAAR